jgi:hypothetical protein
VVRHAVALEAHHRVVLDHVVALLHGIEGRLVVLVGYPRAGPDRDDLPVVPGLVGRPGDLHRQLLVHGLRHQAFRERGVSAQELVLIAGAVRPLDLDVRRLRLALIVFSHHDQLADLDRRRERRVLRFAAERGEQREQSEQGEQLAHGRTLEHYGASRIRLFRVGGLSHMIPTIDESGRRA